MSVDQPSLNDHLQPGQWHPGPGVLDVPSAAELGLTSGPPRGPVGKVRSTGVCLVLMVVSLGIYSLVWYFQTHAEMRRHTSQGLGGGVAVVLAFFIGFASPYLASKEVGDMYARSGRAKPVSALTGLWVFPGMFLVVGPIVWFVKTNGALNAYWRSVGAQ